MCFLYVLRREPRTRALYSSAASDGFKGQGQEGGGKDGFDLADAGDIGERAQADILVMRHHAEALSDEGAVDARQRSHVAQSSEGAEGAQLPNVWKDVRPRVAPLAGDAVAVRHPHVH